MRVALASDLHLEQNQLDCPSENTGNADLLILAGDICDLSMIRYDIHGLIEKSVSVGRTIDWFMNISDEFEQIIWVFGNHEYYDGDLATARNEYQKFLEYHGIKNIRILEDESVVIGNTEIVGSTLWTDFKKRDPQVMWDCQRGMSDYRYIKINGRKLTAEDIADKHDASVQYIKNKVTSSDKDLIIVTHHQPTWFKAKLEHGLGTINHAYYSELCDVIMDNTDKISHWLSGHTHSNRDDYLEKTRLVTNCRGYYGYETMAYDFKFTYFDV